MALKERRHSCRQPEAEERQESRPSLRRHLRLLQIRNSSGNRELRNRVFHHERIIHWADLDSRHAAIMETLGWISSEL